MAIDRDDVLAQVAKIKKQMRRAISSDYLTDLQIERIEAAASWLTEIIEAELDDTFYEFDEPKFTYSISEMQLDINLLRDARYALHGRIGKANNGFTLPKFRSLIQKGA